MSGYVYQHRFKQSLIVLIVKSVKINSHYFYYYFFLSFL